MTFGERGKKSFNIFADFFFHFDRAGVSQIKSINCEENSGVGVDKFNLYVNQ